MKKMIIAAVIAIMALAAPAMAATYDVDPAHTSIGFSVRHLVISNVKGSFDKYTGSFELDAKDALTSATAEIETASINTRDPKRDEHLRSADFFDVAKFPQMTFKIKNIKAHQVHYMVDGELTIHGVTKPVSLMGEMLGKLNKDPWGFARAGFTATGKINRKDFGLNWNKALDAGGWVVGDEVTIQLEIEGIERKAK
jgi:polyisoprenoid-binding protein YceI